MEKLSNREKGTQPLDAILEALAIKGHDLVEVSTEQLTHRMVTKGRKGRQITPNAKRKILNALNALSTDKQYSLKDLFNYKD